MCLGDKKYLLGLLLILFAFCFYGCGKGERDGGERLSDPMANSALPMRVDVTVTPTPTVTPQETSLSQPKKDIQEAPEPSESEVKLNTLSPTPETISENIFPSVVDDNKTGQIKEAASKESIPTPLPIPTPSPTPEREPSGSQEPADKNVTALQEKSASPQPILKSKTDVSEAKEEEQPSLSQKSPIQQQKTQSASPKKETTEKPTKAPAPIVTSYDGVTLDEIIVCAKISNRNPSGAAETFPLAKVKNVYTWMRVSGVKPPIVLKHVYYREGKLVATIKLKIKYASMRTWSQKTFKPQESLGKWKVLVTTENEDKIFAATEFTVVP